MLLADAFNPKWLTFVQLIASGLAALIWTHNVWATSTIARFVNHYAVTEVYIFAFPAYLSFGYRPICVWVWGTSARWQELGACEWELPFVNTDDWV